MADNLLSGAEVAICRQNQCGSDVPPHAIVVARTDFWIDRTNLRKRQPLHGHWD
jgi:hypothetical protein